MPTKGFYWKKVLFALFPRLKLVHRVVKVSNILVKNRKNHTKMRFPAKLVIVSACAFLFIILVGFIMFPKMIKGKIKGVSR